MILALQEPQHYVETVHTVSVKAEEELVPTTVELQDGYKNMNRPHKYIKHRKTVE